MKKKHNFPLYFWIVGLCKQREHPLRETNITCHEIARETVSAKFVTRFQDRSNLNQQTPSYLQERATTTQQTFDTAISTTPPTITAATTTTTTTTTTTRYSLTTEEFETIFNLPRSLYIAHVSETGTGTKLICIHHSMKHWIFYI